MSQAGVPTYRNGRMNSGEERRLAFPELATYAPSNSASTRKGHHRLLYWLGCTMVCRDDGASCLCLHLARCTVYMLERHISIHNGTHPCRDPAEREETDFGHIAEGAEV